MATTSLSLKEIHDLAKKTLLANNCDDETASILADLIMKAERDGSLSHGLFRLPAYVAGLKSGKINGKARPEIKKVSPSIIKVLGNNCLAPMVLNKGLPELIKAAKENGVAVLAITNSHHMAAMWPETETIAEAAAPVASSIPPTMSVGSTTMTGNTGPGDMLDLLDWTISNGDVVGMHVDEEASSLVINIETTDDAELFVGLNADYIGSDDGTFFIIVDGEEWQDYEQAGMDLYIDVPAGTELVEIVGSYAVPEFGTIAMIVLAVAIVSIIAVTAKTRTTLIPKL